MHRSIFTLFLCVSWMPHGTAGASEPADSRAALDRAIAESLKEVHNRGADVHNSGDPIGAWRIYQGALIAVKPLIPHRPEVQKVIDDGMKHADARPMFERAVILSKTIVDARKKIFGEPSELHKPRSNAVPVNPPSATPNPAPGPTVNPPSSFPNTQSPPVPAPILTPTLWDRLGGEKKVEKVVDEWLTLAAADAKVNLSRGGQFKLEGEALATVKRRLVGFISSVSEGTIPYTGRTMKESHQGMNITAEEFSAMVGHLKTALRKENVAEVDANLLVKKIEDTKNDIVTK